MALLFFWFGVCFAFESNHFHKNFSGLRCAIHVFCPQKHTIFKFSTMIMLFYIAGATSEIIKGTHIHVSHKHLQKYLGEFEFRYNMRNNPGDMFEKLIKAF